MSSKSNITRINLETGALEAVSQGYPEKIRESFLWLGGFIINECNRNFDVLEARVKALGFSTTGGTFSKIMRGQYNKDAEGNALESPIMSISAGSGSTPSIQHVISSGTDPQSLLNNGTTYCNIKVSDLSGNSAKFRTYDACVNGVKGYYYLLGSAFIPY
jgi:hypothetical protein